MGGIRCDCVVVVQFQRADKRSLQLGEKVQRPAEKCHMSANGFAAGESADGLVYDGLEN